MACNNQECKCTNCTYDFCDCDGNKNCVCQPSEATCCCKK